MRLSAVPNLLKNRLLTPRVKEMMRRLFSYLIKGVVVVLFLSACTNAAKDDKKNVVAVAESTTKSPGSDGPIIPILKPDTPKRAPASPEALESAPAVLPTPTNQPVSSDTHQILIQGGVSEAYDKEHNAQNVASLPESGTNDDKQDPVDTSLPDELKNKPESQVEILLGHPLATRREGAGIIWTYRSPTCSLDVYFFLDVADNQRRALSYEMLPKDADKQIIRSCYKALKEARNVP